MLIVTNLCTTVRNMHICVVSLYWVVLYYTAVQCTVLYCTVGCINARIVQVLIVIWSTLLWAAADHMGDNKHGDLDGFTFSYTWLALVALSFMCFSIYVISMGRVTTISYGMVSWAVRYTYYTVLSNRG